MAFGYDRWKRYSGNTHSLFASVGHESDCQVIPRYVVVLFGWSLKGSKDEWTILPILAQTGTKRLPLSSSPVAAPTVLCTMYLSCTSQHMVHVSYTRNVQSNTHGSRHSPLVPPPHQAPSIKLDYTVIGFCLLVASVIKTIKDDTKMQTTKNDGIVVLVYACQR